ncbi:MAG: hypothetical protein IAE94_00975 [Chthoniobacterales bacterium]|nr:hypothetical protein [Chthoniobacterales bacterium]
MTFRTGWATGDISPTLPVELYGQYYQRVAEQLLDPLSAVAWATESETEGGHREQALLIGVDLLLVTRELHEELRRRLAQAIPEFDGSRLLMNAVHTHTGPGITIFRNWWEANPRVMTLDAYRAFLLDRLTDVAVRAWNARAPGGIGFGLEWAVLGHCRRPVYADGTSEMYGAVNRPDFVGMEAGEDSGVELIFTWDRERILTGIVVNVACPAQVLEAGRFVSADMAGELRRLLREALGRDVPVLFQVAPAGDLSPRDLTRNHQGTDAHFWDEAGMRILAGRLTRAVLDGLRKASGDGALDRAGAKAVVDWNPVFQHSVTSVDLPVQRVTAAEYDAAKEAIRALEAGNSDLKDDLCAAYRGFEARTLERERTGGQGPYDDKNEEFVRWHDNQAVMKRFQTQDAEPVCPCEVHCLRLGEAVLASNPFELFLEYSQRIKARSRAKRTMLVQLAGDCCGYLPTSRAMKHGGYSAMIINGRVGPEGGDKLVKTTLDAIEHVFG